MELTTRNWKATLSDGTGTTHNEGDPVPKVLLFISAELVGTTAFSEIWFTLRGLVRNDGQGGKIREYDLHHCTSYFKPDGHSVCKIIGSVEGYSTHDFLATKLINIYFENVLLGSITKIIHPV